MTTLKINLVDVLTSVLIAAGLAASLGTAV